MRGAGKDNENHSAQDPQGPTGDLPGPRLQAGSQIGHFRIEREIGRGGAGVVYLARDTRLGRNVAIKSLPLELRRDTRMRSRLKREAKLLASLDHPNIATIHDIVEQEESGGYLILEYIEGDTLAERLARGALDLREVLSLAQQIAEAVAAAHEHGVTHRDLKPGNIKITPEGKVKVLDFGLAKAVAAEAADQESTITEPGRVMGTPAYMSPEQARGTETDKRCDIWSFGCVLYEMLTGKVPFEGQTASDTLAGILEREPNWSALPQAAPMNIRILLRRCLEKDPSWRLRDIGDAAIEIREALTRPPPTSVESHLSPPALWRAAALWGSVGLVLGIIAALVVLRRSATPSESRPVQRWSIVLDADNPAAPSTDLMRGYPRSCFTPDGRHLIYVAGADPNTWLVRRSVDSLEVQRIPGTKGATNPRVSPDGRWLVFSIGLDLWKIPLDGGKGELISHSHTGRCVWEDENTLILGTKQASVDGLSRLDLRTRQPEALTTFEDTPGYTVFHLPLELHAESRTLFFAAMGISDVNTLGLFALSLESHQVKHLLTGAFGGYVPSGHLIYTQPGRLMAAPFDIRTLQMTGQAFDVTEKRMTPSGMLASFAFSQEGALVYVPLAGARVLNNVLVWVDLNGKERALQVDPMPYEHARVSRDAARPQIAADASGSIYIYGEDGASRTRLTLSSDGACSLPVWLPPDNREIVFLSQEPPDRWLLKRKTADGSGQATLFPVERSDRWYGFIPGFCTPDGKVLLAGAYGPGGREGPWDVVRIHLDRDGEIEHLPEFHSSEVSPALSPDGKWNAYAVPEGRDRTQVRVTTWPDSKGGTWQITTKGGGEPVWAPDAKTLYYRDGTSFWAVPVSVGTDGGLIKGAPKPLFPDVYVHEAFLRSYDIHPDGQRFLMIKTVEKQVPITELVVVQNWFEELKRRAPTSSSR